jgi:hypothetical protein
LPRSERALGLSLLANVAVQAGHRLWPPAPARAPSPRRIELARAFDRLQQLHYYTGDGSRMLHACLESLNLSETEPPSPELTTAYANAHAVAGVLPVRGLVEVYRTRALANMARAPDAAAETYFLMLSGVYLTGTAQWEKAGEVLARGYRLAQRLNFGRRTRELTGAIGILHFFRGEFRAARTQADALHEVAFQKDTHTQCWALLSRAQVLLAEGKAALALADAEAAYPLVLSLGRPERVWCLSVRCAAQARLGHMGDADRASREALDAIRETPAAMHYTVDAHALCAEARLTVDAARGGIRSPADRRSTSEALRALARIARVFPVAEARRDLLAGLSFALAGDSKRAQRAYRASLDTALRLAMPYDAARARIALGARHTAGAAAVRATFEAFDAAAQSGARPNPPGEP